MYVLNFKPCNKYVKISCKYSGCPFDVWLNYGLAADNSVTNMKVFRFIKMGHSPPIHIRAYEADILVS